MNRFDQILANCINPQKIDPPGENHIIIQGRFNPGFAD